MFSRVNPFSKASCFPSFDAKSHCTIENSRKTNKIRPKREINNSITAVGYKKYVKPSQIRRLDRRALERKKKAEEHANAQIS